MAGPQGQPRGSPGAGGRLLKSCNLPQENCHVGSKERAANLLQEMQQEQLCSGWHFSALPCQAPSDHTGQREEEEIKLTRKQEEREELFNPFFFLGDANLLLIKTNKINIMG